MIRLAVSAAVLGFVSLVAAPASFADSALPYTDSSAVGTIGLCNKSGALVTSGNIHDRPFVFTAVSSEAGSAPYNAKGGKATLFIYQPRENVVPGRWSGDSMTAASTYTNPNHPMAAGTLRDFSLADYLDEFPVRWDGLLQLRMYLGAPNAPVFKLPYPTTDIRVSGDTWQVVRGGTGDCSVGKATSAEVAVFGTAAPTHSGSPTPGDGKTTASVGVTKGATPSATPPTAGLAGGQTPDRLSSDGTSDGDQRGILLGGVAVVLLAFGGYLYSWRRACSAAE